MWCGIILCLRQGSKVEQFDWLFIPCINIFGQNSVMHIHLGKLFKKMYLFYLSHIDAIAQKNL